MIDKQLLEDKYSEAIKLNDWTILKPYPYLLLRWQIKHKKDIMSISSYASCKLNKHKWCKGNCEKEIIDDSYYNAVGELLPF